jgi:hypothetical protein
LALSRWSIVHPLFFIAIIAALILGYELRKRVEWKNKGIHLVQKVNCSGCGEALFNPEFTPDGYPTCRHCGHGDDR